MTNALAVKAAEKINDLDWLHRVMVDGSNFEPELASLIARECCLDEVREVLTNLCDAVRRQNIDGTPAISAQVRVRLSAARTLLSKLEGKTP